MKWQPARLRKAHSGPVKYPAEITSEEVEAIRRRVVRVRPAEPCDYILEDRKKRGCDATKFWEVNPDDIGYAGSSQIIACEHEVLTD